MRIKKEYEVNINISPVELMDDVGDPGFILKKIRNIYEGKCYAASYIEKITKITRHSSYIITKDRLDASANVSVLFEADAIVYEKGEIISNCTINTIEMNKMVGMISHGICNIYNPKSSDTRIQPRIKKGNIIPVVVNTAYYTPFNKKISCYAIPYMPTLKTDLYLVDKSLSAEILSQYQKLLPEIKIPMTKEMERFNAIFTPWKKESVVEKDIVKLFEGDKQTILDTFTKGNYVAMEVRARKELGHMRVFKDLPQDKLFPHGVSNPKILPADVILTMIAFHEASYMKMLKDYSEMFSTEKEFNTNSEVWKLYEK